jgi:hypothetical protein
VHQRSAVHEEDVGIKEDTGARREEREGDEGMVQGGMEVGVEKSELEMIGICEEENEYVVEEREKESGTRASGQLEEEEELTVEGRGNSPKRQKKLKLERMEEKPPDRRRGRTRAAHTKSV